MRSSQPLILSSSTPCVILFDGYKAGQCSREKTISLPVASESVHYITALPLSDRHIPVTTELRMEGGVPQPPAHPRTVSLYYWQEGVVEMEITPSPLPYQELIQLSPLSAVSTSFSFRNQDYTAQWVQFGGWWIVIETRSGEVVLSQNIPAASAPGQLTYQFINNQPVLFATCKNHDGDDYSAVITFQQDKWQVELLGAGEIGITSDGMEVISYPEGTNLICHTRWTVEGVNHEYQLKQAPTTSHMAARSFLEGMMCCQNDIVSPLLTENLRSSVSIGQVAEFIGPFDMILSRRFGVSSSEEDIVIPVAQKVSDGLYHVKLFSFDVSEGEDGCWIEDIHPMQE